MFRFCASLAAMALLPVLAHAQDAPNTALPAPAYESTLDQASYGIGTNIGRNLLADELELNTEALIEGLRDALSQKKLRMSDEQISAALQKFGEELKVKAAARAKVAAEKNIREGKEFLAANKAKQGVMTLPSGMQYIVLKQGDGPTPKLTDTVRTHYHGTLIDGTVFDSTIESKLPATFPVGGVIRGWTEALQLMNVGSKWRLFVPSELAYGVQGYAPDIGPHAVLIFEVELLGIE